MKEQNKLIKEQYENKIIKYNKYFQQINNELNKINSNQIDNQIDNNQNQINNQNNIEIIDLDNFE